MVAYNFQARFAAAVEAGTKQQTIRAPRNRCPHAKVGVPLQLYTGMRTKACRLLRLALCSDVCHVSILADGVSMYPRDSPEDLDAFARLDGFENWHEMRDWFDSMHGLPFQGVLIRWRVPRANVIRCGGCKATGVEHVWIAGELVPTQHRCPTCRGTGEART